MEIKGRNEPTMPCPPSTEIGPVYQDLAKILSGAGHDADGRRAMGRDALREQLMPVGHSPAAIEWAVHLFCETGLLRTSILKEKQVREIRAGVIEAKARMNDVPAVAATEEFWEQWKNGTLTLRQQEVILLVHGIRTFAGWQPMVKRVLEEIPNTVVIGIKYGYLDAIRFWFPLFTRQAAINDLRREIQNARAAYSDAQISVIAHSFGTYAVSRIIADNPDIKFHRVILSGAIIPRSYRWDYIRGRLATDVVNDYGTRDIWPVLAKCLSWGYGDTGRHGFGRTGVIDRGHNYAHSDFFNEKFVRDYWKPWFEENRVAPSQWEEHAPPPSWFLSILSVVPLQWILCSVLMAAVIWLLTSAYRIHTREVPTGASPHIVSTEQQRSADGLPKDQWRLRYYVKEVPVIKDGDGRRIIVNALRSWEEVIGTGGSEVLREEDATVVLELGPLPFVTVVKPDDQKAPWRVRFSSQEHYDPVRLEAAACHAFGRVFGLGYSDNPVDVMFDYDTNPTAQRARKPSPHDIREIQGRLSK